MTKGDLLAVALWKSKRRAKRDVPRNEEGFVRDVTRIALSCSHERLRIDVLRVLHGVEWPTASVILHLCHEDPYPILDFRALWSASAPETTSYTFLFWEAYTAFCRGVAQGAGVSMRQLDRAMWQYSKEHQKT
ncbi:MAG: hypothetical protein AB7I45_01340 [Planctomycetota bacterium]